MSDDKNRQYRPESYPQPTETDKMLQNQPEFIDQQPNDFRDKSVSDVPENDSIRRQSDDPGSEERGSE